MSATETAGASAPAEYIPAQMRVDLMWTERRLAEMIAAKWNPKTIASYQACAAELRALLAAIERAASDGS